MSMYTTKKAQPPSRRDYIIVFALFFVTYAYFFQGGGWNQNTKVCLMRAMIHQHSFIIDHYREDAANPYFKFVNTGDWSFCNGHYYTNKSPGLSFMAAVPFAVSEYILKKTLPGKEERQILLSTYIANLFSNSLPAALLCLMLFYTSTVVYKLGKDQGLLFTICFGLGTLIFPYSTAFYSHAPAAALSFFAFFCALHLKMGLMKQKKMIAVTAGCAAMLAVVVEPSTIIMFFCLGMYLLSFRDGRRHILYFAAGCIPAAALQLFYNSVCFGGPLQSGYAFANPDVMVYVNGRLFGWPEVQDFIGLLFLPHRGLFISSPIMFFAIPGAVLFFKERVMLRDAFVCLLISSGFLVFIACFYSWDGGWTPGPRYLLPAFPFAFVLTAPMLKKFPKTFLCAGLISIMINLSITLVATEVPRELRNPLADIIFPSIAEGKISINPVPVSHFNNYPGIYELREPKNWTPNFNSFNMGELLFPHHLASILPLLGFWLVCGWLWRRTAKQ